MSARCAFILQVILAAIALMSAGAQEAAWWSLRPLPSHKLGAGTIDGFVNEKLREQGLAMAPEAERRTSIRRLTFDLHGLPPTPEEVEAFAQDQDANMKGSWGDS